MNITTRKLSLGAITAEPIDYLALLAFLRTPEGIKARQNGQIAALIEKLDAGDCHDQAVRLWRDVIGI